MLNMWRKWKGVNLKRRASITLREWSDQRLVPLVTFSLCFYSLRTQTLWEAAPLGLMVILFSTSCPCGQLKNGRSQGNHYPQFL